MGLIKNQLVLVNKPRTRRIRLLPHNLAAAASRASPLAMANSSSVTAAAAGNTKRKSRTGALTLEEVKSLGCELLSSRAHLNHAPLLLKLLSPSARLDLALEALISLQSFFVPLIPSIPSSSAVAAASAGDAYGDPELVFGSWLRQRFDELVAALIELSVSPQSDDTIKVSFEQVMLVYCVSSDEELMILA
jgi:U3 small nucleolar RNA-associated protein 19